MSKDELLALNELVQAEILEKESPAEVSPKATWRQGVLAEKLQGSLPILQDYLVVQAKTKPGNQVLSDLVTSANQDKGLILILGAWETSKKDAIIIFNHMPSVHVLLINRVENRYQMRQYSRTEVETALQDSLCSGNRMMYQFAVSGSVAHRLMSSGLIFFETEDERFGEFDVVGGTDKHVLTHQLWEAAVKVFVEWLALKL